ncbi:hypothetical protein D3C78_1642900 [compost metagenome]
MVDVGLTLKLAYHQLGTPYALSNGGQVNSFNDWSLKLSRPWFGMDLDLIYSNSNLSGGGCDAYSGMNTYCDSMVTFKAQRSFF